MKKYYLAGLKIGLSAPEWAIHENFRYFKSHKKNIDIACNVVFKKCDNGLKKYPDNAVITPTTIVYEKDEQIYYLSRDEKDIAHTTTTTRDWSKCNLYIDTEYEKPHDYEIVQYVKNCLFTTVRRIIIAALSLNHGVIIHSSSIIWNQKGIIFSAPSGIGKSTHAHLWQKNYGTKILDGDATACRIVDGIPLAFGLPWCGTSGEFINTSVPLQAIVFLQQAKVNSIKKLDFQEAFIRLMARSYLLPWNDEMTNNFIDVVQEVVCCTDCYLLDCLPDNDAVEVVRKCLEK